MERLHAEADTALLGMVENRSDSIHDHLPRSIDILVWRRPINQHQQVRANCGSLIDRPQIILDPLLPLFSSSRRKHASAAQARHSQSCIAQSFSRRCRIIANSVAPGRDPLNPVLQAGVHHLAQRCLTCSHLVETQPPEIGH
jgi:hypothetical protein